MRTLWLFLAVGTLACEPRTAPSKGPTAPASTAPTATATATATATPPLPPAPEALALPPPLEAVVHLPPRLAAGQKAPLLLILHSIGTSAEDIESRTDWPSFAAEEGIAWMAPNGPKDAQGRRFWDAGPSCCNFTGQRLDHVGALKELLERTLRERPELDAERVYLGGISNGGFMAHRFACEAPELVRGVVSVSGAGPLERVTCRTPKHLRVLEVHGDKDPIVSYSGGHFLNVPLLPKHASAPQTFTDWAERLGCSGEATPGEPLNLEKRYPGNETRVTRFANCEHGAVELWTVSHGDHYLAFYEPAPRAIWQYLKQ